MVLSISKHYPPSLSLISSSSHSPFLFQHPPSPSSSHPCPLPSSPLTHNNLARYANETQSSLAPVLLPSIWCPTSPAQHHTCRLIPTPGHPLISTPALTSILSFPHLQSCLHSTCSFSHHPLISTPVLSSSHLSNQLHIYSHTCPINFTSILTPGLSISHLFSHLSYQFHTYSHIWPINFTFNLTPVLSFTHLSPCHHTCPLIRFPHLHLSSEHPNLSCLIMQPDFTLGYDDSLHEYIHSACKGELIKRSPRPSGD